MNADTIEVRGLEIDTFIGVPEEERAVSQRLLVDLTLWPVRQFSEMGDRIDATVDYFALSRRVIALAAGRPRLLIETLADEIATRVLHEYSVKRVDVRVRKFIMPDTRWVAVSCSRER